MAQLSSLRSFPAFIPVSNPKTMYYIFCRVGKKGWTFSDQLADFQLLLYLCNFLSPTEDLPRLCKAVTDRDEPLDDGYQLLIRSIAGMD